MLKSAALTAGLAILLGSGMVLAQDADGTVAETIAARRGLMNQLASLQTLINTRLAEPDYSSELYDLGQSAAASLEAFAVLLPPETNLLGGMPAEEGVSTTASATIWDDLPAFQRLLRESAADARTASEASDIGTFKVSWSKVEAACASCHESYVVYDPFAAID